MTSSEALTILRSAVMTATLVCAPVLIICMVLGLIISVLQAATQINEQTLTFVPKLIAIALILLIMGSWMIELMSGLTYQVFQYMLK